MSFIRGLEERRYSKGTSGLYVIPTEDEEIQYVEFVGDCVIPSEDFCEITFRVLQRAGITFVLEDVNAVRKVLFLEPILEIKDEYEAIKAYFTEEQYKALRKSEENDV